MLAISSFGLGALHALEPGHGKTVVGAYLIGSKGRISDAVLLGIVVTLTHSGSVILLGVLSIIATHYFVPETVQKILAIVSGLLIIAVGGWMLNVRIRQTGEGNHTHHHDHNHDHECDHTHNDDHCHHDQSHIPNLAPGERPTIWQLITLGVSGGIVPCHSALAVLLAAISFGNFGRGLALVIIHSIGMATVLVAIGIMMVKAADFAGKYVSESKWTKRVPVISAILITLVGIGLTIKAIVNLY
jgi:nickel/cobalt exporter